MNNRPFRFSVEELNILKNKIVNVELYSSIKINTKHIEGVKFKGYFDTIVSNGNPPHYPLTIYFIHESISEWPEIEITDLHKTIIALSNVKVLELA